MSTKRKPPENLEFTAARFSQIAGIDRHELQRRLEELSAAPSGQSPQGANIYGLAILCRAFAGGDLEAERIRKTRAEAERIEIQNARSHGELIQIAKVKKLGETVMVVLRTKILGSTLPREEQDSLLLEIVSLGRMDWSRAGD